MEKGVQFQLKIWNLDASAKLGKYLFTIFYI